MASDDGRILEQIKVRESGLSLHHALALELLTRAVDHKRTNPGISLRFRFTTTATVARERGHPEPNQPPGLEVWERLRHDGSRKKDLELLKALLGAVERPASVSETAWLNTVAEFSDNARLAALVSSFEWAMDAASPDDQSAEVLQVLVRDGYAADEARAREIYEQLFADLFRLLSRKGEKRLTHATLLKAVGRPRADDPETRTLVQRVRDRLDASGIRLSALDARVGRLETQVATSFGLPSAAIALGVPELDIEPPPLAMPVASRTDVIAELAANNAPWLALVGAAGVGKSHLALMVARAMGRRVIWLRLGRSPESSAGALVIRTLAGWARTASLDPRNVMADAAALIGQENAVLVVNDLPGLTHDHPVARVLGLYLDLIGQRPLSLITSSVHPLPSALSANRKRCLYRSCPAFSDAEAREIFEQYDGKPFLETKPKALALLNAIARGHPTLLKAMASYLRERNWTWDQESFGGIFGGKYAEPTHAETRAALTASVTDSETRQLLDRLRLQNGDFGIEEIRAVAAVPPAIARPVERAREVEGIWLQKTRENRFRISPLLGPLPKDLPSDIAKGCHFNLARERLKGPIDQNSGAAAVSDLAAGGAYDMAGLVLTDLLLVVANDAQKVPPGLLLEIWWDDPLPQEMSSAIRIVLRHAQVVAGQHYSRPALVAARELDELIHRAGDDDQWAVASVETQRFMRAFESEPERAAESLERAISASGHARLPDGSRYAIPDLAPLVWVHGARLSTRHHVRAWLRLVGHLPVEARNWDDGSGGRAATVCQLACDGVWLRELQKEEPDRRWGEAHEVLDEIRAKARAMPFPFLEACAARAKMTVLSEHNGRGADAIAIADTFMSEHRDDRACAAMIEEALGRLHFYVTKSPAQALVHLRRALDHPGVLGALGPLVANYASRAAAQAEHESAVPFARIAVELAVGESPDPTGASAIGLIQAKGELAIALWNAGDVKACAEALLDAAEHLQANITDAAVAGTVGGGFLQVAGPIGMAVSEARVPEEQRRVRSPGFLYEQPGGTGIAWRSDFAILLAFEMCQIATSVADEDRARLWAGRALDCEAEGAEHGLASSLQLQLLVYLLLSERDDAMVAVATRLGRILRADRRAGGLSRVVLEQHPVLPMLGAVLPLAIALGTMAVSDTPRSKALSDECARVLSEFSKESAMRDILAGAADLLPAPYKGLSYRDLGPPIDRPQALQDIAFFQGSLCEDFPIEAACQVHLRILSAAWKLHRGAKRLVERFIDRFWTNAFHRQRFRFRNPRELERTLNELTTQPLNIRSRRLLGAIAGDLGVKLSSELRDWCRAT